MTVFYTTCFVLGVDISVFGHLTQFLVLKQEVSLITCLGTLFITPEDEPSFSGTLGPELSSMTSEQESNYTCNVKDDVEIFRRYLELGNDFSFNWPLSLL